MRNLTHALALLLLTLVCCTASISCAGKGGDDEGGPARLTPVDVPANVMATIKKRFPYATIKMVSREREHGKMIYDFEMNDAGTKWEADVAEDGTLLETERQIPVEQAPAAVMNVVKQKHPKGTVREVMAKTKGNETAVHEYEIVFSEGGKTKELTLSPEGKVVEEE